MVVAKSARLILRPVTDEDALALNGVFGKTEKRFMTTFPPLRGEALPDFTRR